MPERRWCFGWTPAATTPYRVERRFSAFKESDWGNSHTNVEGLSTPNRYGLRNPDLTPAELDRVRGGGWDLALLQKVRGPICLHFDVCGVSRQCFNVLHDHRDLSVHFMLDLDGTIYQTLDLKERAWHLATISNTRSVGIEIANMGAYAPASTNPRRVVCPGDQRATRITIPPEDWRPAFSRGELHRPSARPDPVTGVTQGKELVQYDYTPEQYQALIKLTATLCRVFPKIKCDYPRTKQGRLITEKLPDEKLKVFIMAC